MLADHRAGNRKRILLADHAYCIGVSLCFDTGYISGNIDMRRTQSNAGYRLRRMPDTSFITDMTFVFVRKLYERVKDQIGTYHPYGTVSGCCDHTAFLFQSGESLLRPRACQYICHQSIHLDESVSAGYTLTAALIHRYLKQGAHQRQRTHPGWVGHHTRAESVQQGIDPFIHIIFDK